MFITKRNKLFKHPKFREVLGVASSRLAKHCGLEVGEHSPDSSCMREEWPEERRKGRD